MYNNILEDGMHSMWVVYNTMNTCKWEVLEQYMINTCMDMYMLLY